MFFFFIIIIIIIKISNYSLHLLQSFLLNIKQVLKKDYSSKNHELNYFFQKIIPIFILNKSYFDKCCLTHVSFFSLWYSM